MSSSCTDKPFNDIVQYLHVKGKLEDIGNRLGLTPDEVDQIRSTNRKARMFFFFGGFLLALFSFILGLIIAWLTKADSGGGGGAEAPGGSSGGGYPYAVTAATMVGGMKQSKPSKIMFLVLALSAFFAGFSTPVFGQSIDYGVYKKVG